MTGTANHLSQRNDSLAMTRPSHRFAAVGRAWMADVMMLVLLVAAGVTLRLVCCDLPNFAPVAAMALFAGYVFRSSLLALLVPLSVMAISDWVLGGYHFGVMALVYGMLALPVAFRGWLRHAFDLKQAQTMVPLVGLLGCGLVSSLLFFLVTNFGVWCWFGAYERSLAGLWHCYVAAIPFFRYTLAGDLIFSVVLFGSYALAMSWGRQKAVAPQVS